MGDLWSVAGQHDTDSCYGQQVEWSDLLTQCMDGLPAAYF